MKFNQAIQNAIKMFDSDEFINTIALEDHTMLKNFNIIKEINKLGYLTLDGQAGNKKKNYEERSYLIGFMLKHKAELFIKYMNTKTDKSCVFVAKCCKNVDIPSKLDIPLTIYKKEVVTHTSVVLPDDVWNMFRKQAKIDNNENIVFITCWDPKWKRYATTEKGLFTDILKILKYLK